MTNPAAAALQAKIGGEGGGDSESLVSDRGSVSITLELPDGSRLKGTFSFRVPASASDLMAMGVAASKIRQGYPPEALDDATAHLAVVLGYLEVALVDLPPWAAGGALLGLPSSVVFRLYEVVRAHEAKFRGAVRVT